MTDPAWVTLPVSKKFELRDAVKPMHMQRWRLAAWVSMRGSA